MKERIRQLEDALAILQARGSNEPHPLLRDDLLSANTEHEEDDMTDTESTPARPPDIIDAFGTLSVSEHGVSRFFGPTGGAEVRGLSAISVQSFLMQTPTDQPPRTTMEATRRATTRPPTETP